MATFPSVNLAPGMSNDAVKQLQAWLIGQGYGNIITAGATGYYGNQTKSAVTQWQKDRGITPASSADYGYWGPLSIAKATTSQVAPSASSLSYLQASEGNLPNIVTPITPTPLISPAVTSQNQGASSVQVPPASGNPLGYIGVANAYWTPEQEARLASLMGAGWPRETSPGIINSSLMSFAQDPSRPLPLGVQQYTGALLSGRPNPYAPPPSVPTVEDTQRLLAQGNLLGAEASAITGVPYTPVVISADTPRDADAPPGGPVPPGVSPAIANSGMNNWDKSVWELISQPLDPQSPEYQDALAKIETSYYDILKQQLTAQTEQEKQVADYNWNTLRNTLKTTLGLNLSADAIQAWEQIQGLKNQFGAQGVVGSGFEAEAMDDYLRKVRAVDQSKRLATQSTEDTANQTYYTKFATPEKIKEFVAMNPEKAKAWGLMPSDEVRNALTPVALKAKSPNLTDEQVGRYIASVIDENGNYRSALYQKYYYGGSSGVTPGNIDVGNITYDQYGNPTNIPVSIGDTGLRDIEAASERYKALNAAAAAAQKEFLAHQAINPLTAANVFDRPDVPASSAPTTNLPAATLSNPLPPANAADAAAAAANINQPETSQPPAPIVRPGGNATTPYDWYKANNLPVPDWTGQTWKAFASKYGVANYTGSDEQNRTLVNALKGI